PGGSRPLPGGGRGGLQSVRGPGSLGAQGDPERRRLRQVLERSHDRRICVRHLAREAVPGVVMEPAMIHDAKEAEVISPLAGKPATPSMLVDLSRLEREYYDRRPQMDDPTQVVAFGTSG